MRQNMDPYVWVKLPRLTFVDTFKEWNYSLNYWATEIYFKVQTICLINHGIQCSSVFLFRFHVDLSWFFLNPWSSEAEDIFYPVLFIILYEELCVTLWRTMCMFCCTLFHYWIDFKNVSPREAKVCIVYKHTHIYVYTPLFKTCCTVFATASRWHCKFMKKYLALWIEQLEYWISKPGKFFKWQVF